jgi:hypothetical protein
MSVLSCYRNPRNPDGTASFLIAMVEGYLVWAKNAQDGMRESEISWDGRSRFARLVNPGKADGRCRASPSFCNASESE